MKVETMARTNIPMQLRLPPDLKAFVETEAARNGSSQNSEVIRAVRERMERAETD